jgi:hypothetical protein
MLVRVRKEVIMQASSLFVWDSRPWLCHTDIDPLVKLTPESLYKVVVQYGAAAATSSD